MSSATASFGHQSMSEGSLPRAVDDKWLRMDFWSPHVHAKKLTDLFALSIGRDLVRLRCQKTPTQALD